MDKMAKLIYWQRITILGLLVAVSAQAYGYYRERQQMEAARATLRGLARTNLLRNAERDIWDARRDAMQAQSKLIDDLRAGDPYAFVSVDFLQPDPLAPDPLAPGAVKLRLADSLNHP